MIVYQKNKETLFHDVRNDTIVDQVRSSVLEKLGRNTAKSEFVSWSNSLRYMRDALDDSEIPNDCGVSIDFQIPSTPKRIDFIGSDQNESDNPHDVIAKLRQWSSSEVNNSDGHGAQLSRTLSTDYPETLILNSVGSWCI